MISSIISRLVILLFGTLYPAYSSYKAVRTKNVKEYVKWMMYWIVFALFTCIETFTDVFLSWFPFYYEIKIVLVIWLLSPATKGSSILYRKFVHPTLSSREQEIDEYINKAKEQSYKQVLDLGSKGMTALMQTALKGGGGLVNQLRRSYSLTDLSDTTDATTVEVIRRRRPAGRSPGRSATTSAIYFSEVDIRADIPTSGPVQSILSAEDISSGYSSAEGLYSGHPPKLVSREPLHRTSSLTRTRTTRSTRSTTGQKSTRQASDDSDNESETFDTNIIFLNDCAKKIDALSESRDSSEGEFYETADTPTGKNPPTCSSTITAPNLTPPTSTTSSKLNLLNITKDVDTFSSYIQNLIDNKSAERQRRDSEKSLKAQKEDDTRGGKYNKKVAPLPPQNIEESGTIKATLVLQPGHIKTLSKSCENTKEIFLNSPKSKRRHISTSPKNKLDEALNKMRQIPKRISSFNLPKIKGDKRFSWHLFHKERPQNLLSIKSKSDNNIADLSKRGSDVSIKSLTESPLSHRRLKIIRRYVDEDID